MTPDHAKAERDATSIVASAKSLHFIEEIDDEWGETNLARAYLDLRSKLEALGHGAGERDGAVLAGVTESGEPVYPLADGERKETG